MIYEEQAVQYYYGVRPHAGGGAVGIKRIYRLASFICIRAAVRTVGEPASESADNE